MAQPQSRLLSLLLELGRPSRQCLGLTRTRRPRPWTRPLPLDLGHHGQTRSQSQSRPRIPGSRLARPLGLVAGGGLLLTAFVVIYESGFVQASRPAGKAAPDDTRDRSLPRLRLATVREHDGRSAHPWVTHEDKVYDITDWVAAHPGGDVILRAAGGALEPYWAMFAVHGQAYVREILDQYLIGLVDAADLVDGRPRAEHVEDPFAADPVRDGRLITHTDRPRNAETPSAELADRFLTPNELFYVRNHMWVPVVDEAGADDHALTVELPGGEVRRYSLATLRTRFPVHRVAATLQCSGNRRDDMSRHAGRTNGLQWGVGAIGNAEWEGVRLADVLADAGLRVADGGRPAVDPDTYHVHFSGLEAYGASIPLAKALDPRGDVLLAFGMNGAPLPRDHGFPLRAVVPGHVAARSVKWLSRIVVAEEESPSQWQRRDYKSFGPNEGPAPDWDRAPAIQEMPVTSAITRVWVGDRGRGHAAGAGADAGGERGGAAEDEPIAIALQGYAYSGGGRAITRVDVSLDGGRTWDQAELVAEDRPTAPPGTQRHWTWRRWRYRGRLRALPQDEPEGRARRRCATVVVKATDAAYNTQPETHASVYNVRGNLATAWHRVTVCAPCTGPPCTGPPCTGADS